MERRRLLANGTAAVFGGAVYGIGPVAEFILPIGYHTNTPPSRAGISDVERVRVVTAFSRWLDSHHGGGSCADILRSQLANFDHLLNTIVQDKVRAPLFCAVGDAYLVAARAQAELGGDLRTARALLAKGLELAKEAQDRSLLATILVNVAHLYGQTFSRNMRMFGVVALCDDRGFVVTGRVRMGAGVRWARVVLASMAGPAARRAGWSAC